MNKLSRIILACTAGLVLAGTVGTVSAQELSCDRTRAEVRNECIAFKKTHRWDEPSGNWVLKSGEKPPEGVRSREEIRAERDAFMKANRWNEASATWEPIGGAPRDVSKMTREEVRRETQAFMRTHRWDEATEKYVDRKR